MDITCHRAHIIWKIKTHYRVKIILWILSKNKLLISENLHKKDWSYHNKCVLRDAPILETDIHLFLSCPYSSLIWRRMGIITKDQQTPFQVLPVHWSSLNQERQRTRDTKCLATFRNLWKEQNRQIFANEQMPSTKLLGIIMAETTKWLAFY